MDPLYRPGKYVVAVSGGVDSMVLLHLLAQMSGLELVAAHYDHGIRPDSRADRELVGQVAASYGIPFIYEEGHLGAGASEATARAARYGFLRRVREGQGALAICTAHHKDDVLETAILNLARGTGRRGLSSLRSTNGIVRPLLPMRKEAIVAYARQKGLRWREDSTNADEAYLRNYIRRRIVPAIAAEHAERLHSYIAQAALLNDEIDRLLEPYIAHAEIERKWFVMLPHDLSCEVMASWLRRHGAVFDRRLIDRSVVFGKTAAARKQMHIDRTHTLETTRQHIILLAKQ